jgi:radical SAM family uncharacterized protein
MNEALRKKLETQILPRVERPGRYSGGELNVPRRDFTKAALRMCMTFPDVYEIGMSHLGFSIVYHLANECEDVSCERAFAPWPDMEKQLREHGVPMFSLETKTALQEFDILGVTLAYELGYSNLLTMLDLGGIPLKAADRDDSHPLVLGGGCSAFNPEPMADFFDLFLIGEAEDALPEILALCVSLKKQNASRGQKLLQLAAIPGVYVPCLYEPIYEDNVFKGMRPMPGAPEQITKRFVADMDAAWYPDTPIMPGIQAVHDRARVELFRGCTRGCRFCNAGMIYRPLRARTPQKVVSITSDLYEATGSEEVTLLSFNATDYPGLEQVLEQLDEYAAPRRLSVSLPSTRVDSFTKGVGRRIRCVRPSGLTFAPEAGSQRLRDVINKQISNKEILDAVDAAADSGWNRVKLYFMIGLPTETMDDVEDIAELVYSILTAGRGYAKKKRRFDVTVSLSTFIPKPHTPFQWESMDTPENIDKKQIHLRHRMNSRRITLNTHDTRTSVLEGAMSRGGRNLAPVIESAWRAGARFDGWTDVFDFSAWENAFHEHNMDIHTCAQTALNISDPLPWDHISTGVLKKFLLIERTKAMQELGTPWCDNGKNCHGCGLECKVKL